MKIYNKKMLRNILFLFIGGGIGTVLRYGINRYFNSLFPAIPAGTFIVNITGSLLLGFLFGLLLKNQVSQPLYLLLGAGLCGGFTTFSSFLLENNNFLRSGDYFHALFYIGGSIIFGIVAVISGMFLAKLV